MDELNYENTVEPEIQRNTYPRFRWKEVLGKSVYNFFLEQEDKGTLALYQKIVVEFDTRIDQQIEKQNEELIGKKLRADVDPNFKFTKHDVLRRLKIQVGLSYTNDKISKSKKN